MHTKRKVQIDFVHIVGICDEILAHDQQINVINGTQYIGSTSLFLKKMMYYTKTPAEIWVMVQIMSRAKLFPNSGIFYFSSFY